MIYVSLEITDFGYILHWSGGGGDQRTDFVIFYFDGYGRLESTDFGLFAGLALTITTYRIANCCLSVGVCVCVCVCL